MPGHYNEGHYPPLPEGGSRKGKGKGKGQGKANAWKNGEGKGGKGGKGKGSWLCPVPQCKAENGDGFINRPTNTECHFCGTPKAAAPSLRQAAKEKVRADIAAEKAGAKPAAAGPAGAAPKPAVDVAAKPVAPLSIRAQRRAAAKKKKEDAGAAKPVAAEIDLVGEEGEDLGDWWDELMSDDEGESLQKVEFSVDDVLGQITNLEGFLTSNLDEATKEFSKGRIEELKTKLTKLTKDQLGSEYEQVTLVKLKADLAVKATARRLKLVGHAAKDEARAADVEARLRIARIELDSAESSFASFRSKRNSAWDLFNEKVDARDAAVVSLVDARIAALAVPDTPELLLKKKEDEAAATALAEAKKAEKEAASKVKAAEEAVAEATAAEENKSRKLYEYWAKTVPIKQADLPDLSSDPDPDAASRSILAKMHYWHQTSSMGDAQLPFAFSEMGGTAKTAQLLLGHKVWEKFFGKEDVADTHVCPMQCRTLMFRQLATLDQALLLEASAAQETAAQELWKSASSRLLSERSNLRGSPYGNGP